MLISCCWELINCVMVMDVIFLEFGIRLLSVIIIIIIIIIIVIIIIIIIIRGLLLRKLVHGKDSF